MDQSKMKMVKQEIECLNIAGLDISKLKWTGMKCFQSGNYKVFYSENCNSKEKEWL